MKSFFQTRVMSAVQLFILGLDSARGFSCLPPIALAEHAPSSSRYQRPSRQRQDYRHSPLTLFATPIPNEFSRPLNTDRILKTSSGNTRRSYRDYQTTIEANPDECAALASRFDLKRLDSLKADLSLSLPSYAIGGTNSPFLTVQVEGSILASLTQTCVRTNEDFEVTVEFPLLAIVKPVSTTNNLRANNKDQDEMEEKPKKNKSKRSSNKTVKTGSNRISNINDMMELQQMMERQDETNIFDLGDDVLEDEAIYSSATGVLDVGELVAQSFWLNLDPYPKKPGSGPVEYTITG